MSLSSGGGGGSLLWKHFGVLDLGGLLTWGGGGIFGKVGFILL